MKDDIYCITYIRYEEMLIHISHDTVPAPWFSRSKRQVLDSAFFVISITPDPAHCLASSGDNLFCCCRTFLTFRSIVPLAMFGEL